MKTANKKQGQKTAPGQQTFYKLRLYIAGDEPNSRKAVETVRGICEAYLGGRFDLQIIDVFQDYRAALKDRVLVAPTLIWLRKGRPAFLIGSFGRKRLLDFLGLADTEGEAK
jgi:circadian clock protein KaiB